MAVEHLSCANLNAKPSTFNPFKNCEAPRLQKTNNKKTHHFQNAIFRTQLMVYLPKLQK